MQVQAVKSDEEASYKNNNSIKRHSLNPCSLRYPGSRVVGPWSVFMDSTSCLRESLHSIPIPLTVQSVWCNAGTTTWGTGSKQHGKNFVVCHISQEILQCEWSSARYWFLPWALDFVNEFQGRLPQVQLLIVLHVSGCIDPGFMRRYPSNNYRSIPNSWNSKLGHQIIENHTKECFKAAWIRCRTFVNADAKLTKSDPSKGKPKLEIQSKKCHCVITP